MVEQRKGEMAEVREARWVTFEACSELSKALPRLVEGSCDLLRSSD